MTKSGGREVYFGKAGEVSYREAKEAFGDHLKTLASWPRTTSSADVLCDMYLEWLQANRSRALYLQLQHFLSRWCDFELVQGGRQCCVGDMSARAVTADHLLAWKAKLYQSGLSERSVQHALSAVKSCWNWGVRHGHLPQGFRPFATVEKVKMPPQPLTEADLMSEEERDLLFKWADADLGKTPDKSTRRYRTREPSEYRPPSENPYVGYEDLLRCYYHTGARTSELCSCRVRDTSLKNRVVVLGRHKRSRTMRTPETRVIMLNNEAFAIFKRNCHRKPPDSPRAIQASNPARFQRTKAPSLTGRGIRPASTRR